MNWRQKGMYVMVGIATNMAILLAVDGQPLCFVYMGLAAFYWWLGNIMLERENKDEDRDA